MRSIQLAILSLLLIATSSFAQQVTWTPVNGANRAVGSIFLTADSLISNGSYVLPNPTGDWKVNSTFTPVKPPTGYIVGTFGDTTFAALHDTLLVSYDSGKSYKSVAVLGQKGSYYLAAMERAVSGMYVIGNTGGMVYTSTDYFHAVDTAFLPDFTDGFPTFTLDHDSLLWLSSQNNIFRSVDRGQTWSSILHFGWKKKPGQTIAIIQHDQYYYVTENIHNAINKTDSNEMIQFSSDRGATWSFMLLPTANSVPNDLVVVNPNHIFVVFRDNLDTALFRSDNLGQSWQRIQSNVFLKSLFVDKFGYLYLRSRRTGLYVRSGDLGASWTQVPNRGMLSTTLSLTSIKDTVFRATTDSLYASHDAGINWETRSAWAGRLGVGYGNLLSLDAGYLSNDGGRSFTLLGSLSTPTGGGLVSRNGNMWVITISGTGGIGQSYAYQTLDSGQTWGSPMFLSSDTVRSFVESRDTNLIVASRKDLLKGNSSIVTFSNVSPEALWTKQFSPSGALGIDSNGTIYTAMHDGKMFASSDNTKSWSLFPSPAQDSTVQITAIIAGPRPNLFAVDSNTLTGLTSILQFNYKDSSWQNITASLSRTGFSGPARIANVYYAAGYLWTSTANLALFRSVDTLSRVQDARNAVGISVFHTALAAFPNPSRNGITVNFPAAANARLSIVDIAGRIWELHSLPANSTVLKLSLAGLPNGDYDVLYESPQMRSSIPIAVAH